MRYTRKSKSELLIVREQKISKDTDAARAYSRKPMNTASNVTQMSISSSGSEKTDRYIRLTVTRLGNGNHHHRNWYNLFVLAICLYTNIIRIKITRGQSIKPHGILPKNPNSRKFPRKMVEKQLEIARHKTLASRDDTCFCWLVSHVLIQITYKCKHFQHPY